MFHLQPIENLDLALIHITQDEAENPIRIIEDYCDEYAPGQAREYLDDATTAALIYDDQNNHAKRRENFVVWTRQHRRMVEAVFALNQLFQKRPDLVQSLLGQ